MIILYKIRFFCVFVFAVAHAYWPLLPHDDVIKWKHFPRYWPFVTGEFPAQRPVTRSFGVFFDLRLNKRLNEKQWGWWFETSSQPLWRHCNDPINSQGIDNITYSNVCLIYGVYCTLRHLQGPISLQISTQIGAWIFNCMSSFFWGVITHACPTTNGGLSTPPLKLGHGWVIASRCMTSMCVEQLLQTYIR